MNGAALGIAAAASRPASVAYQPDTTGQARQDRGLAQALWPCGDLTPSPGREPVALIHPCRSVEPRRRTQERDGRKEAPAPPGRRVRWRCPCMQQPHDSFRSGSSEQVQPARSIPSPRRMPQRSRQPALAGQTRFGLDHQHFRSPDAQSLSAAPSQGSPTLICGSVTIRQMKTPLIQILGLAHIGIRMHDLERSARFYQLLGFTKTAGPSIRSPLRSSIIPRAWS